MSPKNIIGLSLLPLFTTLGSGCANKASSPSLMRGNAMVHMEPLAVEPRNIDIAVESAGSGNHSEAMTAFYLAAISEDESPAEAADAFTSYFETRVSNLTGESGIEELKAATAIISTLAHRMPIDPLASKREHVVSLSSLEELQEEIISKVDSMAVVAANEARTKADEADKWFVNDREIIHYALVILAPYSIHADMLSRTHAADIMAAKKYVLSYVSDSEHQSMLQDAGHIKR